MLYSITSEQLTHPRPVLITMCLDLTLMLMMQLLLMSFMTVLAQTVITAAICLPIPTTLITLGGMEDVDLLHALVKVTILLLIPMEHS